MQLSEDEKQTNIQQRGNIVVCLVTCLYCIDVPVYGKPNEKTLFLEQTGRLHTNYQKRPVNGLCSRIY